MRYYLDTNALYAVYRHKMHSLLIHPNYQHYTKLEGGRKLSELIAQADTELFISRLTSVEFISRLLRHVRAGKKEMTRDEMLTILQTLDRDTGSTFQLIPQTDEMLQQAQNLLLTYGKRGGCALDTNDAIHIAAAMSMEQPITLITSDGGRTKNDTPTKMKCVCERIGLAILDPEL